MPIYEYKCSKCSEEFEKLVFSQSRVNCPKCGSEEVKKKLSTFGMSGMGKPSAGGGQSSGCGSCSSSSCSSCH
ncbi:MAG: zinc ribbon domain-containing protein [Nitrospiraceae bacterium]|nr:zinc ribbon domain-containing protein [Nitrospiraceae bacterium]MDA8325118.1 zinc ribbon domain-containing protein [Nitrospiraceae bacterium]